MPKSVEQIRQQIAKLQQQEQALLSKEIDGVVARIREAVSHYKLTPDHIFGELQKPAAKTRVAKAKADGRVKKSGVEAPADIPAKQASVPKGTKIAAKFKDDAGNSWSGRGSQPRWLKAAIAAGKKIEDFAVV